MRVLVTGGSGFIGRYVVKRLRQRKCDVIIYDIEEPKFKGAIYRKGSMLDTSKLMSVISDCDAVMHLAGLLGTSETVAKPIMPTKVNVMGSLTVFAACHQYSKPCCYIAVGNHFMLNTYAISKTCAERFALMYNKELGSRIAVVRGLNAYGPYQKHKPIRKVIPNFIIPALRGQDIITYGSGEQIMDFIYVDDLAQILCRALLNQHDCYYRVLEAGSGQETTINFIAERIKALTMSSSKIVHVAMRPGEIPASKVVANIETLKSLGDISLMPLDDGLRKTIAYYEKHLQEFE